MSISEERCGKGFIGVHVHLTYDVEDTLTYNGAGFKVAPNTFYVMWRTLLLL